MPFDPDDPRLTAYALGELDLADRVAIEAILRDDPDARGFILGVEETARLLAEELRHEATASDGLDPARREAIERHLSSPAVLAIAAPPAKARFRAWMPVAAAAGIIGVAAAITLPKYLARHNAPTQLARVDAPAPVAKDVHNSRWGAEVVSADDYGAPREAAPEPSRPAPPAAVPTAGTLTPRILLEQKEERLGELDGAVRAENLSSLSGRESRLAQNRAGAGEKPPEPAAVAAAAPAPVAGGGRAAGGMGGMGGGMGGAGGVNGMAASRPSARPGGLGRGVTPSARGPQSVARNDLASGTRPEAAARDGQSLEYDMNRSKDLAERLMDKSKGVRDHALGNRLPMVVGTQGGGIANFQPNLNVPGQQVGFGTQMAPLNGIANGQPSAGAMANAAQPGQQGQLAQNAAQNALGLNAKSGVYYYDTSQANAANMPGLATQGQGAANSAVQSVQNQGLGQQGPGGQTSFSVTAASPEAFAKNINDGKGLGDLAQSRSQLFARVEQPPMANSGSQGQSGQPGNSADAGLNPAQQVKPAAASAAEPGRGFGFGRAAQAPAMQAPAGRLGQAVAAESAPKAPAAIEAQNMGGAKADHFDAVEMKVPAAEPAQASGKPEQTPPADMKTGITTKSKLEGLVEGKKVAEGFGEAGVPEKAGAEAQALAKPAVHLALADGAVKARLAEVDREVDAKRGEIRQLAEEAEILRRQTETLRRQSVLQQTKVDREAYARFYDHPFQSVLPGNELSTFAIDVDTGSYANVRRFLSQGQLPPPDAVRIEELLNYFRYDDPAPKGDEPFSVNCEVAACPWDAGHRLARVGLKGKTIEPDKRPMSNLVFLIDVSGSMSDLNKLPLLKAGMKLLVEQLTENDRVGIVTYSNDVKEAFPSTPCHRKAEILAAIDALQAGGGTNGGAGIQMAYGMAEKNFLKGGGTNRVILATDGDFNVGMTKEELLATGEARAKSGIFLTVIGFGEGNLQEAFMEQLADKGNGHYLYIDTIEEARKVLVRDLSGTLVAIAKDVKVQLEFNPDRCSSYRLIGYENRVMEAQDFRDDKKDAGEIGAGHSVTALYEIVPTGAPAKPALADRPLKYRRSKGDAVADKEASPELFTVYLRYKQPDGDKASEISRGVVDDGRDFGRASTDLKFSASVAGFGMLLRGSPYKGTLTYTAVQEIASSSLGADPNGDRKGFLDLIRQAEQAEGLVEPPAPR